MERPFNKWLALGLCLTIGLIALNVGIAFRNTALLHTHAYWVDHTNEVLDKLDELHSTMKDAQSGERGYLITGDERFLAPYDDAIASLDGKMENLKRLTADNERQQARIPRLQELARAKLDELEYTIALRKQSGFQAAQAEVLAHLDKNRMIALRAALAEMAADEQRLLRDRRESNERAYRSALASSAIAAFIAAAGLLAFAWLLQRHLKARRHAAAALHQQHEWFRITLSSIGDAVIATNTEGRVTFLNSVAQALTGWEESDAAGQPLENVFRIVNEQSRQTVENPAIQAIREGRIVGLANHTILIARSGAEIPIDDSAAPIRDEAGQITGVVLVFRDISARKRVEYDRRAQVAQLADAEVRMRSVVNNVIDGIITIDERGIVESLNPAAEKLFGYRASEISGQNVKMLMPMPYHGEHDTYIANYLRTGQAKIIGIGRQVEGRRKDGTTFPMELAVGEFQLDDHRFFTGVVRDITDRKAAEEALKTADRRKNEFLATLAHELRGPLTPIRNSVELLKRAEDDRDLTRQARATIERQMIQMVRLVDDLLDINRITRNRLELRRERVEMASIVEQSVEACRPQIEDAGHELSLSIPPQPIPLYADPVRVVQVLNNLLNNACKYTQRGGRITLSIEREGSDAVIRVKDNGIGIPAEMLPKVFEMFTQLDMSLERSQGGLGIGLSLVKKLVELHGGSVEARSDGVGRGSEFIVRLPVLIETASATRAAPQAPRPACTGRRILIVEDNRDAASSLSKLLQLSGNETRLAYDGAEALEVASTFLPDIVLLDIGLPKINGYDVCRSIRAQAWGTRATLIALTGWGQDEDRQKTKDAGFNSHLVKPVDFDALLQLLTELQPVTP